MDDEEEEEEKGCEEKEVETAAVKSVGMTTAVVDENSVNVSLY